jgi:polyisoprenoid-binding protein YceI
MAPRHTTRTLWRALWRGSLLAALTTVRGDAQQPQQPQQPSLAQRFDVNAAHSLIGFTVGFMGLSTVRGAFSDFDGTLMYVEDRPERSTVSVVIAANSINTNNAQRDRHLRSPDFFDVQKYPYITFRSTSVRRTGAGAVLEGDLTMHGVTERVAIPVAVVKPPTLDAWRNKRLTLEGRVHLSRKRFGILGTAFWNSEFDPGRMAVSDDVNVELLVSATVPNAARWGHPQGDSLLAEIERRGVPAVVTELRAAGARLDSLPDFALQLAGEKLFLAGRAADAVLLYEGATQAKPSAVGPKTLLGDAYARVGQYAKARAVLTAVLEADSLNTLAFEWLRTLPGSAQRAGSRE